MVKGYGWVRERSDKVQMKVKLNLKSILGLTLVDVNLILCM